MPPTCDPFVEIPSMTNFFNKVTRCPKANEKKDILELVANAFNQVIEMYKYKLIPSMTTYSDNELYIRIQKQVNENFENREIVAEAAMARYICEMIEKTNKDYFVTITKFIILFREGLNSSK